MPHIPMSDIRKFGEALGHTGLAVVPMKPSQGINWVRGECGCGYRTTRRNNEADAAGALIHHVMKAVEYNATEHVETHAGVATGARTGRRLVRTTTHRPALTVGLDQDASSPADTPLSHAS